MNSGVNSGYKALIYIHRINQADLNEISNQLNIYDQQLTFQETFDKKQKNKQIAKRDELCRYHSAYQSSIEQLSHISLDDGVKQNYEKFQNISIEDRNGEIYMVSLFTKI